MARLLIGADYSIGDYDNGDLIVKTYPKTESPKEKEVERESEDKE